MLQLLIHLYAHYMSILATELSGTKKRIREAYNTYEPPQEPLREAERVHGLRNRSSWAHHERESCPHFLQPLRGNRAIPGILPNLLSQVGAKNAWTTFQTHFVKAQANLQERQQTSRQWEYYTGTANNTMEFSMDFANLAHATAEDLATMKNLTTANSTLAEQVVLYANHLSAKEADNMAL